MYTWVLRTAAICTFVLPVIAGCAGDDDAPPGPADTCTPNMSSLSLGMAMSAQDPCGPQKAGSVCDPAKGHIAYAMCGADGKGVKDPVSKTSVKCDCMTCGNRIVESIYGEQCEAMAPLPTCADLTGNKMSTGVVSCSPTCTLVGANTCTRPTPPPVGGNGG